MSISGRVIDGAQTSCRSGGCEAPTSAATTSRMPDAWLPGKHCLDHGRQSPPQAKLGHPRSRRRLAVTWGASFHRAGSLIRAM
jgi:hypothetical protein